MEVFENRGGWSWKKLQSKQSGSLSDRKVETFLFNLKKALKVVNLGWYKLCQIIFELELGSNVGSDVCGRDASFKNS